MFSNKTKHLTGVWMTYDKNTINPYGEICPNQFVQLDYSAGTK